jgi:hypothetical protein
MTPGIALVIGAGRATRSDQRQSWRVFDVRDAVASDE